MFYFIINNIIFKQDLIVCIAGAGPGHFLKKIVGGGGCLSIKTVQSWKKEGSLQWGQLDFLLHAFLMYINFLSISFLIFK